jgi:MinD superfamily P-loop ATPase
VKIVIASGKGGTGKTTIATNLALTLKDAVYLDCDVEEPDGHLFLNPIVEQTEVAIRLLPEINYQKCNFCGRCAEICQFHALAVLPGKVLLFEEMCHSCGVCAYYCPEGAIREKEQPMGNIRTGYVSPEGSGFVEGCLNIGEMMASPLIRQVKATAQPQKINILDAPPGTSCSMVETVRDADYCLLVTEPTPFGMHDLKLAVKVLRILQCPFAVVENKAMDQNDLIGNYCHAEGIPVLLRIPFDRKLAEAYSRGEPAVRIFLQLKQEFLLLYNRIQYHLKTGKIFIEDSIISLELVGKTMENFSQMNGVFTEGKRR